MKYLILLVAVGLAACASTTPEKLRGAEYYYKEGQKAMDKKRCIQASEHFQRLVSNFPGSQRVAEAQFMLAEAYFCS
jgi:outer membrane protein assembly factor BamD (BamD/ComL family)